MNEYIRIKPRAICTKCNGELEIKDVSPNFSDYSIMTVDLTIPPCKHCLKLLNALEDSGISINIKRKLK